MKNKVTKINLIKEAIKIIGVEGTDEATKWFDKLYDMPNSLIVKTIQNLKKSYEQV